jgi:di/tricarboxylate transporter
MVHWPRSVGANVMALMLALIVVGGVVQLAIALSSHPLIWAFLVVVALTTAALIVRHRRAAAAQDLAVADAPSFGDVLPHWDRHDDLTPARF